MKNKSKFFFFFFIPIFFYLVSPTLSNEIKFEAENIETIDKELITATNNVIVSDSKGNKIYGNKLTIKDEKIYTIVGDVIFENIDDSIKLNTKKIIYNIYENKIKTIGDTKIIKNDTYFIDTSNIIYDIKNKKISSKEKTFIEDLQSNKIEIENFNFLLKESLLKANSAKIIDKNLNHYELKKFYYDLKNNSILGKDLTLNQNNNLSNEKYLPRAKGRSFSMEDGSMILKKSIYTNCKKRDGCPPWSIKAEEVKHDKKNKIVKYKNASFRFYDVPVLYFPKFFHPDPTVKRQSGFLAPSLLTQNAASYLKTPYFFALTESSDFTFSPRFYENQKNIYQGEYRKVTKNANHIFDASINNDSTFLSKKNSSQTHFFSKSTIETNFDLFDYSKIDLQLQNVSNDKYLKTHNINSPIINSNNTLNSKIEFEGSRDNLEFYIDAEIYEDLTKKDDSDKYELIFPNFNLSKVLDTKLSGSMEIVSTGYNKLFETNINEKVIINDLKYKSLNSINPLGMVNNFEFLLKNFNANSKNSKTLKNRSENSINGILQLNSKLPMQKNGEKYITTITPIIVGKFNPQNNKNISNEDRMIDYTNIYSIDRISSSSVIEGGESLTLGNEFKLFDKKDPSEELFSINLASSFRAKENFDLPKNSFLGQKTSNLIGQTNLKLNNFVDLKYDFLTDNNLEDFKYHKLNSKFTVNNFISTFEFTEENDEIGTTHFISNETSLKISDNKNLLFRTRKNKKTDLTEYYNLIYQYKIDCLIAAIEYNKDYYRDGELKPEESISLSLTIMPFDNSINLPKID
tara:strand:- start:6037 stop:8436 length:2400 start_codon:yes stop_codon:yes gene_type:complete